MRALIAVAAAALAAGQDTPQDTVRFKVTTQLVTVNVAAADKDGNPVTGLKASDFTLTEDGKKQKISVFEFQKLEQTPLTPLPLAKAVRPKAAPAPVAATLPAAQPGEIRYKDRRLMVLYFDMASMPIQDQMHAQESALKFLQTQMTSSDLVAIMSFTSQVNMLHGFSADRESLLKTVNGLIIGDSADMAESGATGDDTANSAAAFTADDTEFNIFNTDRKLVALQSAVKMLGALPEKKALIYYSSGINKTGMENEAQMRATTNAAVRANVSLFPIDARGLMAFGPGGDASKGGGGKGAITGVAAAGMATKLKASQEALHTLAADTGGKEMVDNNDLAQGIVEAQKQISSYYIVGYYSTNAAMDGQFRRIKLQLDKERAHVKLDYRPGYFAGKDFKQFTAGDRERQLQEALLLGDPLTDLSLAMEINFFRLAADRYFVPIQVKLPAAEIDLAKRGDAETARLDFIGEVKDPNGKVMRSVRDNLEIKLKGITAADFAKKSLAYDTGFALAPGKYSIKFLARENVTGKMGTFETTFIVPDLAAEKNTLPISSVVLSNQVEAQGAAIASGEQDKKTLAQHPLIFNGRKLVPSVTRAFRKGQNLFVYLEAYQLTPDPVQPVAATVALYRGKQKVFESPTRVMPVEAFKPQARAVPLFLMVPLATIEPGKYTCQVTVQNVAAQKVAFWRAPMAVLP